MLVTRKANPDDSRHIAALVRDAQLPLDGIESAEFVVAEEDGITVGCAGLEIRGSAALLRSVAVSASSRGRGIGDALIRTSLETAAQRGLEKIFLLTTTAPAWFPRFGFEMTSRDAVPEPLLASEELRGACPDSAVVMSVAVERGDR